MTLNKPQVHYVKVKRDKVDHCNICAKQTTLCWDHVPPQGGIEVTPVEQVTILQRLTGKEKEEHLFDISKRCKISNDMRLLQ